MGKYSVDNTELMDVQEVQKREKVPENLLIKNIKNLQNLKTFLIKRVK